MSQVPSLDQRNNELSSLPPEGSKVREQGGNSLAVEATVDVKPQELRKIRNFALMDASIPGDLQSEAQIVLKSLFACFDNHQNIQEGLIGDWIWGFEQCNIAKELTYNGLGQLAKAGYIKFRAKDNTYVELSSDKALGAFVEYQPKLLSIVLTR